MRHDISSLSPGERERGEGGRDKERETGGGRDRECVRVCVCVCVCVREREREREREVKGKVLGTNLIKEFVELDGLSRANGKMTRICAVDVNGQSSR